MRISAWNAAYNKRFNYITHFRHHFTKDNEGQGANVSKVGN